MSSGSHCTHQQLATSFIHPQPWSAANAGLKMMPRRSVCSCTAPLLPARQLIMPAHARTRHTERFTPVQTDHTQGSDHTAETIPHHCQHHHHAAPPAACAAAAAAIRAFEGTASWCRALAACSAPATQGRGGSTPSCCSTVACEAHARAVGEGHEQSQTETGRVRACVQRGRGGCEGCGGSVHPLSHTPHLVPVDAFRLELVPLKLDHDNKRDRH